MTIEWKQVLKDAITGQIISALLDAGFRVEVSDRDGGGLFIYAWDEDEHPDSFSHWVQIQTGNDPEDMITDYSTNLEKALKPALQFARTFR